MKKIIFLGLIIMNLHVNEYFNKKIYIDDKPVPGYLDENGNFISDIIISYPIINENTEIIITEN